MYYHPFERQTGRYDYCIDHKYNNTLTFSSIFGSKLELRVSYKAGKETEPPFGCIKNVRNEMVPLMNLKEA